MMAERFFEDLSIGMSVTTAAITVTREDALDFAHRYDPQPFHLDDAAAERSAFGRLAISGWQTASYAMRLLVDSGEFRSTGILGIGVDELRWLAPVYPNDTLSARGEIVKLVADPRGKRRGLAHLQVTVTNQDGAAVLSMQPIMTMIMRPTDHS